MDLYAYTGDNPVNEMDPSGLAPGDPNDSGDAGDDILPSSATGPRLNLLGAEAETQDKGMAQAGLNAASFLLHAVPGVGTAASLSDAVTGCDALSGRTLSTGDRVMAAANVALSLIPGGGEEEGAARAEAQGACNLCLAAGTPVWLADGSQKPIEDVRAGDQVASRDPQTGRDEARTVTATVSRPAAALVTLSLADLSSGRAETLTCTPDHPLYVQGKGWAEAGDLGIGTSIVTRAGPPLLVQSVSWRRDETGKHPFTVYNLTVQGDHTYFAGDVDGGLWAHNACANRVDYHHIFPAFRKNATYGGWFKKQGINPNAFTVPMDTPYLTWLHDNYIHGYRGGIWNQEWRDFIDAEPASGYTMEEIWAQASKMMDQYDIPGNWFPYR